MTGPETPPADGRAPGRDLLAGLIHWSNRYLKGVVRLTFNVANRLTSGNLPSLVAAVVVVEQGGEVLMIRRRDGLGLGLPGGIVRWNEVAEATAVREAWEETGFDVALTGLIGIYSGPARDPRFSCVEIAYAGRVVGGAARSSVEGEVLWVPLDSPSGALAFDHGRVIADFLSRSPGG